MHLNSVMSEKCAMHSLRQVMSAIFHPARDTVSIFKKKAYKLYFIILRLAGFILYTTSIGIFCGQN